MRTNRHYYKDDWRERKKYVVPKQEIVDLIEDQRKPAPIFGEFASRDFLSGGGGSGGLSHSFNFGM
jgi:hypothetical protein